MKQQLLSIAALAIILASCSGGKKNEAIQQSGNVAPIETEQSYLYAENRDSIKMVLKNSGGAYSGTLDFLPYEKDGTIGTLNNGYLKGDTLFAGYNSYQEGQESDCEIALLKKGDAFILSNDSYTDENYQYNADYTKGTYKDKSRIKFDGETLKLITVK